MSKFKDRVQSVSARITVRGGFPVIAEALLWPADPSVGYPATLEDLSTTLKGKPCSFLEKKPTPQDWEDIAHQLLEAL